MDNILDDDRSHEGHNLQGRSLQDIVANGYTFDFGACFNTGWNAMKSDVGQYILFALVAGLIFVVSIFTIIGAILIFLPLWVGYYTYGAKVLRNEPREFGDFFGGFKFFTPLLGFVGLLVLFGLVVFLPLGLATGLNIATFESFMDDPIGAEKALSRAFLPIQLIGGLITLVAQVFVVFTLPLIVIGQLGVMDAIRWSARIASKNFGWLLLYIFVVGLISQSGVLACYIGMLFTIPFGQCLSLGAYAEIIGLGDKRERSIY
jgi:membrane-anchored glycerophosphoryl diester phosphodiesterase (GDPDase)